MNCYCLKNKKIVFYTFLSVSLSMSLFSAIHEPKAPATASDEINSSQIAQVIPLHKNRLRALSADAVSTNIQAISKERSSRIPVRKAWSSKKPSKVSLDPKESPETAISYIQTITETATEHRAYYAAHSEPSAVATQPQQPIAIQAAVSIPESQSAIDIKTEAPNPPSMQLHTEPQTMLTVKIDDTQYCTTVQPKKKLIDEKDIVQAQAFDDPEIKQWYINAGEGKGPLQNFVNAVKEYFNQTAFRAIGTSNCVVAIELEEGALTCYNALVACNGTAPATPNDIINFIQHLQVNKPVLDLYNFFHEHGYITTFFSQTLIETNDFDPTPIVQKSLVKAGYLSRHAPQVFINTPSSDRHYTRTGWHNLKRATSDLLPIFIVISSNNSFFQKSSVDYAIWLPSAYRQHLNELQDYNYLQKISQQSYCDTYCSSCLTCVML